MKSAKPYYDSPLALEQYLFFHYGSAREYLPAGSCPREAFGYPVRAPRLLVDYRRLPEKIRALDLGCATGATSLELSRRCDEVVGIDLSTSFIRAAQKMQRKGRIENFSFTIEGSCRGRTTLRRPAGCRPDRVTFLAGDALQLPAALGTFDLIVMLNLIDRLPDPLAGLKRIIRHLRPGGQLVIASPYTWLEEYTPRNKWPGGQAGTGTFDALLSLLKSSFRLHRHRQIPFIIREHARKYQWSIADGTTWIFRGQSG